MKKVYIIIAVLIITVTFLITFGINWLFGMQYNKNGISHFLVITKDKSQPKEYVGELEEHKIYIEKLKEANFRNIEAENVSIKEAIEKNLTSIKEWKKYARRIKKQKETEIMQYENYEIACTDKECIIRPL